MTRPRLLVLSFSPISRDARVLRQVRRFSRDYDVATCGFGPAPDGVAEHFQIPDPASLGSPYGRLLQARLYRRAYSGLRPVRWVREYVPKGVWDAVLANDVEAAPVALEVAPADRVHVDLHEFAPRMREDEAAWLRLIAPWVTWMCRRYVARAASTTTVGSGLAREYQRVFGLTPNVVTNAAPYAEREPGDVGERIRLVHSGGSLRRRRLHLLIDAFELLGDDARRFTLDFYLTPNDPHYLQELRERAAGMEGVEVHDAVPYAQLIPTLGAHDVGIHVLPPVNFNSANALPNKLFEYVQARLGVVVGPTPEMADIVREHDLGGVTEGFGADELAAALRELDRDRVQRWKQASDAAADALSGERAEAAWVDAIGRIAPADVT